MNSGLTCAAAMPPEEILAVHGLSLSFPTFGGYTIFLTVLFFNLFGDGLRAALDPKLK